MSNIKKLNLENLTELEKFCKTSDIFYIESVMFKGEHHVFGLVNYPTITLTITEDSFYWRIHNLDTECDYFSMQYYVSTEKILQLVSGVTRIKILFNLDLFK